MSERQERLQAVLEEAQVRADADLDEAEAAWFRANAIRARARADRARVVAGEASAYVAWERAETNAEEEP